MKRFLSFLFTGAMLLFGGAVPGNAKEKAKTGVLSGGIFSDSAFGYAVPVPATWKAKTRDEPSLVRLALEKSDVQINPRFSAERSNAGSRPRFVLLADTTSYPAEEFLNRLLGESTWKGKGEYLKALDWRPLDQEVRRSKVSITGQPGFQVTFLRNMSVYFGQSAIPTTGSEFRAEVVTVFKKENRVFTAVLFSSQFFLEGNFKEILPIFSEWKFIGAPSPADSAGGN